MKNTIAKILLFICVGLTTFNVEADEAPLSKGLVLCVSLGMPDLVLQQYLAQANKLQIPIVIRGMVNNDMKTTTNRLFSLLNPPDEKAIQGGVAIDPHPFRIAHITAVPALIVSDGSQFDVVYGNSNLANLIHVVASNGSTDAIKNTAKEYDKQNGALS